MGHTRPVGTVCRGKGVGVRCRACCNRDANAMRPKVPEMPKLEILPRQTAFPFSALQACATRLPELSRSVMGAAAPRRPVELLITPQDHFSVRPRRRSSTIRCVHFFLTLLRQFNLKQNGMVTAWLSPTTRDKAQLTRANSQPRTRRAYKRSSTYAAPRQGRLLRASSGCLQVSGRARCLQDCATGCVLIHGERSHRQRH